MVVLVNAGSIRGCCGSEMNFGGLMIFDGANLLRSGKVVSTNMGHTDKPYSFPSTRWSVVGKTKEEPERYQALEDLCAAYWNPIYGFIRRVGYSPSDAEDSTQAFFAKVLAGELFGRADQSRGKLRSFLLTVLKRFLADEKEKERAQKRGGQHQVISIDRAMAEEQFSKEPVDGATPESLFERRWALTVLENVLLQLRREYVESDREEFFRTLEPFLAAPPTPNDYRKAAEALGMKEATMRVAVFRLRRRYGEVLRQQISDTLNSSADLAEELDHLMSSLSS